MMFMKDMKEVLHTEYRIADNDQICNLMYVYLVGHRPTNPHPATYAAVEAAFKILSDERAGPSCWKTIRSTNSQPIALRRARTNEDNRDE